MTRGHRCSRIATRGSRYPPRLAGNDTVDPTVPLEPLDAAATGGERASRSGGSVRALQAGLPEPRQPLREI